MNLQIRHAAVAMGPIEVHFVEISISHSPGGMARLLAEEISQMMAQGGPELVEADDIVDEVPSVVPGVGQ